MKKTLLIISMFLLVGQVFAQGYETPENYKFKKADDYKKSEKDIVSAIDWLSTSPVSEQKAERKKASAFFMTWLTGTPTVSIELNAEIITFMDDADCLLMFMAGWTKYSIEKKSDDKVKGTMAGIENVIAFYKKNKSALGKNKAVEKYIKLQNKGELAAFIKKHA